MSRLIEIYGVDAKRRLHGAGLPLVIGANDDAHIALTEAGIGTAAYVGESRNHLFLQPAEDSPVPIYHNDDLVQASVWLKSGDVVRIGETLIHWHFSGKRVEVRVTSVLATPLRPPVEPPVVEPPAVEINPNPQKSADPESLPPALLPPVPDNSASGNARLRALVIGLFLLLLLGAAFVLLANPLTITLTPTPDSLSVSGFPPVVKFGGHYLGLSGDYLLQAEKSGYQKLVQKVTIDSSGRSYQFDFEKMPGLFNVSSTPAGVTLLVDGSAVGETPLQDLEIPAGTRLLRFEHPRYLPVERSIEVEGFGVRSSLQVELQPAWALVALATVPAGATLLVDGEEQGVTPLELELLQGSRQLVFRKDKFVPLEVALEITAREALNPPVYQLEAAPGRVAISSLPVGATVSVDGEFQGQTPLALTLKTQVKHAVRVTAAGYLPATRSLELNPEEEQSLVFELEPQYGTLFIAATPPAATLLIDGKPQPLATGRFRLITRPHTLKLSAPGYQSITRTVTPKAGYSQQLELTLTKEGARTVAAAGPALSADPTTGIGQKLIRLDPRPFVMGASRQEPGRRANETEHPVALKRSFYISAREVTNREYLQYQSQHSSGTAGKRSLEIDSHPVVNVTWDDAARFMNWLSRKDGLPPFYREEQGKLVASAGPGSGYRLPTEAEWEFVARVAGHKERARYPWSGSYPPKQVVGNFADESARYFLPVVIKGYTDSYPTTAPVGSFAASPVGLYDLGGNVAEWCHDYYSAFTGKAAEKVVDPMGAVEGTHHVVRGSSWRDASLTELRFSYRRYSRDSANDIGFRVARYAQ